LGFCYLSKFFFGVLLYLLKRCGFGEGRRDWIAHCISTVLFFILINNSPRFFSSLRGLRHEDPLSPLLFLVIIELLCRMMSAIVDKGLLSGFLVGLRNNEEFIVLHVLFVDEILNFFEVNGAYLVICGLSSYVLKCCWG
jgi:hypothetical protein